MAKLPPTPKQTGDSKPIIKQNMGKKEKPKRIQFASKDDTRTFINTDEEWEYRRNVKPSQDQENQE